MKITLYITKWQLGIVHTNIIFLSRLHILKEIKVFYRHKKKLQLIIFTFFVYKNLKKVIRLLFLNIGTCILIIIR